MISNKDRDNFANFKKITKSRVATHQGVSPVPEFNQWTTIYKETMRAGQKRQNQTSVDKADLCELISVRSMNKSRKSYQSSPNKENVQKNVLKGFFAKREVKPIVSLINKAIKESRAKTDMGSDDGRLQAIDDRSALRLKIKGLISKPTSTANPIGQNEHYLDPMDANNCPGHSKVVVNPDDQNFLNKNIHAIYRSTNEYYPLIGGECLCGTCLCGSCKCIHMKYKGREQSVPDKPIYKTDYVKHDEVFSRKQIIRPQQILRLPNECVKDSLYRTDYHSIKSKLKDPKMFNRSKVDNIGPCATNVKIPLAQMTVNKLDYPDWGFKKIEPLNVKASALMTKKLPSSFKTQNQDYGAFFKVENGNNIRATSMVIPKPTNNFFGPALPMDYSTQQKKDFRDPGRVSTEKRIPKTNLYTDNQPFLTKFKSIKQDYGDHPHTLTCPVKERIRKVKDLIRAYADENKIPL